MNIKPDFNYNIREIYKKMGLLDSLNKKTVKDAFSMFMTDCLIENKSKKTVRFYSDYIKGFAEQYAEKFVHEITTDDIRTYLQSKQSHIYAVNAAYNSLRVFFSWCIKNQHTFENPVVNIQKPRLPKKVIPVLSPDDIKKLMSACDKKFLGRRNMAIVLTLLDSGMRLTELVNLKMSDVDIQNGLFRILGKGNKERIVRVGQITKKVLWDYIKLRDSNNEYLWLSEERTPLKQTGVQLAIKKLARASGVGARVNPHSFRHTFATNFLRNGGNVFDLQSLLGHSSLEMVKRYSRSLSNEDAINSHIKFSPVDKMF